MNQNKPQRTAVALTNPAAGHGRGESAIKPTLRALREQGLDVTTISASSREEAEARCLEAVADQPDLVISIGGDGTHAVAVQAAVAHGVPLAIIPAGTGNDLARALGIPRKSVDATIDIALNGEARSVDVARVRTASTDRHYVTVLTSGFDSLVTDRTNTMTWPHGRARYVTAIAVEYVRLKSQPFRVVVDGEVVHDGRAILTAVGNTESYGGGMRMCAGADPTDGLLDVTVLDDVPHPRLQLPQVLPRVFRGTHVSHPAVHMHRGRVIEIDSPTINGYADGDLLGSLPVTIEAVPGALSVLLPHGQELGQSRPS